jgi:hypothetical protein
MTPAMRRILRALDEQGDMDTEEISEAACVGINTLSGGGYLTTLLLLGKIRVSRWVRNVNGAPTPIYSVSPGKSKPKPKPYSNSEKTRRWRLRSGYRSPAWYARKSSAELVKITSGVAA